MFYSHQLLARKAPLGQIWMAATMHAKMNRRKLDKLNLIKICEEILNPSVPLALRISGILMGGVVIVYERKVKLLYDDVNRFLAEVNEAFKGKSASDSSVLPKRKSQAKKEAVTLPENEETDIGDIEHSRDFSNATMGFQQAAYCAMRLDEVDESYVHNDPGEEDPLQNFHKADVDIITLSERFDCYQANTDTYNRFERFDIEEDMETQLNFTSGEHNTQMPTTLIPSPSRQDEPHRGQQPDGEIYDQHPENQVNQQSDESKERRQGQQRQGPFKRKIRRPATPAMDGQTVIPGHVYQSWLQDTSDIVSRKGRKRKFPSISDNESDSLTPDIYKRMHEGRTNIFSKVKTANLMELPPVVLTDHLFRQGDREIPYPAPILELWRNCTQPPHDSSSEKTSPPQPPEPSPPERVQHPEPAGFPLEDIHSGVSSQSLGVSIEKLRGNIFHNDKSTENLMEANFVNNVFCANETNVMVTPGNSDDLRSIPSSASGHGNSEVNSSRSNQKRPCSSSRQGANGLEPVEEERSWNYADPNFKLSRLSENVPTPDPELLVETGPTQTQDPIINPPADKITDSIRTQLKMHFDAPGAPKVESLNTLAAGMNRKGAAMLFYQTCVLASRDCIQVEQKEPYGDIFISRGAKM